MQIADLDDIIAEVDDECWRCGGSAMRAVYEPIIGAIVVCDCCGHEHYFSKEIPDVPHYT